MRAWLLARVRTRVIVLAETLGLALVVVAAPACGSNDRPPASAASPARTPTPLVDSLGNFVHADGATLSLVRLGDQKAQQVFKYTDSSSISFPSVSPNGQKVAFSLQKPAAKAQNGAGSEIAVVDVSGANLHDVANHAKPNEYLQSPVWINDTELLFDVRGIESATRGYYRIEKLNLATGARSVFLENAIRPAVSPDRKLVAYDAIDPASGRERLFVANIDLTGTRPLTNEDTRIGLITSIAFSPDARTLVFAAQDLAGASRAPDSPSAGDAERIHALAAHPGAQDIWVVNVDGSGLRKISDLADARPSLAFGVDPSVFYALTTTGLFRITLPDGQRQKIVSPVPLGDLAGAPR